MKHAENISNQTHPTPRPTREGQGGGSRIQIWSALAMLAFGAGLSVAGFCVPPLGEIADSVLLIFAQCLIYAGSALGIDYYVNYKLNEIEDTRKRAESGERRAESGELRAKR